MKKQQFFRMAVDLAMTVILLLLMGYSRVGEAAHEWLGVGMLVLFVLHHILNRKWILRLFKGRYSPYRVLQTLLVCLILASMVGSAWTGIKLSGHVFTFLGPQTNLMEARELHMRFGYWNFVLLSLHLGLHWIMIVTIVSGRLPKRAWLRWLARLLGLAIAVYGVHALIAREVKDYLFGTIGFGFFDQREPLIWFLLDYLAIMGLFVWIGHYLSVILKKINLHRARRQ